MNTIVRAGRPGEAAPISRLAAETFPAACPPEMTPEAIQAFIAEQLSPPAFDRYLADPRFRVTVAAGDDGALLGYTLTDAGPVTDPAVLVALDGRDAVCLSKVYVAASARGQGVSPVLVQGTLDTLRRDGHRYAWLGVNRQNTRANAFYERMGFRIAGQRTFPVGTFLGHDHVRVIEL